MSLSVSNTGSLYKAVQFLPFQCYGSWLREWNVYFCLRLKKNHFVEMQTDGGLELNDLGLAPGISFFLQGVKVTKIKGFISFNVAGKWQRKIL